jgi:hypothetical protein
MTSQFCHLATFFFRLGVITNCIELESASLESFAMA